MKIRDFLKKSLPLLSLALLAGCSTRSITGRTASGRLPMVPAGSAWGVLWQQKAAEYRALCYQAYQTAALRLEDPSTTTADSAGRPPAIVTDIDETILDNSPYYAHLAVHHRSYTDASWIQWTKKEDCTAVPGSVAFFQQAAAKGIRVFYITNRLAADQKQTLNNLRKLGFPDADSAHLLLMQKSPDKRSRRAVVLRQFHIVLLLGDNLGDFSSLFDNNATRSRLEWTESHREFFGKKFIVLPNIMYGNWEDALYPKGQQLSEMQKSNYLEPILNTY